MNGKFFLILFLFIINSLVFAQQNEVSSNNQIPPVYIAGTQMLTIHSSINNQDYDLYINLPRDYNDSGKTFPVIYLLDGQ